MLSAVRNAAALFFLLFLAAAPAFAQLPQLIPQDEGDIPVPLPASQSTAPLPASSGYDFPVYPVMFANVRFWESIYGTYAENQGLLHDKDNLDRVYKVISLLPATALGAAEINKKLIEIAQLHCQEILKKFAAGAVPQTSEELQIYALFKLKSPAVFLAAADNMRVQTGLKNRFREGVIRSGAYMPAIKRILRMHGLPLELAYLPHVESSFNPTARSKAGAVSLWQFTSYTGKDFMMINELVDERYDLYASANAAALFLKENYRQLGAWPLALTAYNHGRGGMLRAKQEWSSYPLVFTNYLGKSFGFASKNFYSEFVAAYRVARRLESDATIIRERPLISASVRLKNYASAPELMQYFGVSAEEFRRLNPALRAPLLDGKKYIPGEVVIHLPATHFIRERIRSMPANLFYPNQRPDPKAVVVVSRRSSSNAKKAAILLASQSVAKNSSKAKPAQKNKTQRKK